MSNVLFRRWCVTVRLLTIQLTVAYQGYDSRPAAVRRVRLLKRRESDLWRRWMGFPRRVC